VKAKKASSPEKKINRKPITTKRSATAEDGDTEATTLPRADRLTAPQYAQQELFPTPAPVPSEISGPEGEAAKVSKNDTELVESANSMGATGAAANKGKSTFTLAISESLVQRLKAKAQAEGVTVDEFAAELLAEGLVLRAWEIMERKSAMRQPQQSQTGGRPNGNSHRYAGSFKGGQQGGNFNGNRVRPQGNNHQSNHRRSSYKNVMEDSASFLEYVRSQEKR
jgi:predicted DNA binding CopG/RHH family protein